MCFRKRKDKHMEELFSSMPLECIQATNEIVEYATISLGKQLSNYLYLNLCDHIHFAIQRSKGGIPIQKCPAYRRSNGLQSRISDRDGIVEHH